MTDWTDNHMTTDRKDGQSENYGFTLVINTPPPVYDSGSKPLEVVGERTFNIKDMEIKDEKIKLRIWCLQHPSVNLKLFDLYEWIANSEDEEEMKLRMICVETEHMHQFKSLDEALNWLKAGKRPTWAS